ncbi:ARP2/3 complex 16 kDa subunit (p16-Arc) [Paxillus ammoniavirescens]|nr:ARP2/3 complex 16 kDa subunit (p16-Arc) [Paxillus ammoniavirescens]
MSFRTINVDAYDEDVLTEDELYDPDTRDLAQVLSDTKQQQAVVRSSLNKGDITGALNMALGSPPYGPGVKEAKNFALQTVVSVLNSTKATDIPNVLRSLAQNEQDTLMKYIYKGMGMPGWGDVSGSVLLGWHEKLTEAAGTGCIVRVMTDRRTV